MPKGRSRPIAAENGNGFDITTRYVGETADVELLDPAVLYAEGGRPKLGARITIRSMYAPEVRAVIRAEQAKLIVVDGKIESSTPSAPDNELVEQVVVATVAGNLTTAGAPIPCDAEHVRAIYTDPRTAWIFTQVRTAYLDLARFFASGTPS